jgi:hypothetical protein
MNGMLALTLLLGFYVGEAQYETGMACKKNCRMGTGKKNCPTCACDGADEAGDSCTKSSDCSGNCKVAVAGIQELRNVRLIQILRLMCVIRMET